MAMTRDGKTTGLILHGLMYLHHNSILMEILLSAAVIPALIEKF